ncbi:MAG: hypothetical protein KIT72_00080 [Polyangiaceae bacterium]|nr:hypothetical protein [Polyangiaceae bacterium]MCW5788792.1 hypothetical protein [Polyangiaceae bacterium]
MLAPSCSEFDDTRKPAPASTLGDDVYSALCNRVGAAALTEDLEGFSYRSICNINSAGQYGDTVDERYLGVVQGSAALTRALAISKLEALAQRRPQLIRSINATFPAETIQDPWTGEQVAGHVALSRFLKGIAPLYDANPIEEPAQEDALPSVTRAAGRLFAGLAGSGRDTDHLPTDPALDARATAAQTALASISGRQGYRPARVALGALRPTLAYPELRQLAQATLPHLEPGGRLYDPMQDVLGMTEHELATSVAEPLPAPLQLDASRQALNRPRTKLEVARAALLSEDPSFGRAAATPSYLVQRDSRGMALPNPSLLGSVFIDQDGDGSPDVDALGRLLGPSGPAAVDPPFVVPGAERFTAPDGFGRALTANGQPVYQYVDTSRTLTAALTRDLEPLIDPDPTSTRGSTIIDLLRGAHLLYGEPVRVPAPWAEGGEHLGFDTTNSPLLDLIHAVGQVLAHPRSDGWLKLAEQLFAEHEADLARMIGAALHAREVSNRHPEVQLARESTFWDELIPVVVKVLRNEGLLRRVLTSLRHPNVLNHLTTALANFNTYADRTTYDPRDLNSSTLQNLSTGDTHEPIQVPVDRSQPDTVGNQSQWYQALQIIHDMSGVNACNRPGAKVRVKLLGIDVAWPLIGSGYQECELLRIRDIGLVYLDSLIDHYGDPRPPEGLMEIEDRLLSGIMNLASGIVSVDQVFEQSSRIQGMSLNPTPQAFNRLVFFGTTSDKFGPAFGGRLPDEDPFIGTSSSAADTNRFISSLIDPISTRVCPTRRNAAHNLDLADCSLSNANDLLRLRGRGAIFTWEKHQFYTGIAPVLQAFDDPEENGELFLELIGVLYRHWPSPRHGPECSKTGTWERDAPNYNPKYCAESGLNAYEPILAEIFRSDLLPALARLSEVLESLEVDDTRSGRRVDGVTLLRELGLALLDTEYANSVQLRDRQGRRTTSFSDGSRPNTPLTPFELFASTMRRFDDEMANSVRREPWRRARSTLVDTFLTIEGTGANSRFRNTATPKAAPTLIQVLRQQTNAQCPTREAGGSPCAWGTREMAERAGETFSGPTFGTVMHLIDQLSEEEETRTALVSLLHYLLRSESGNDALTSTRTSLSDLLQLLGDDERMPPIYNAISWAASPQLTSDSGGPRPGAVDRALAFARALTEEPVVNGEATPNPYDRYRMLDRILRNLVTPLDPGSEDSLTPIDVFMDTLAEVNRIDAAEGDAPLDPQDFAAVFGVLRDFMLSEQRGMEQFFEIVRGRNGG